MTLGDITLRSALPVTRGSAFYDQARTFARTFARASQSEVILRDLSRRRRAGYLAAWPGNGQLITRRSQVQILPPLSKGPGNGAFLDARTVSSRASC